MEDSLRIYQRIMKILTREAVRISMNNSNNLTDINILWEKISMRILNVVYGWNLCNLNSEKQNFSGIDLGDKDKGIEVQVTSDKRSSKIRDSLVDVNNKASTYTTGPSDRHYKLKKRITNKQSVIRFLKYDFCCAMLRFMSKIKHLLLQRHMLVKKKIFQKKAFKIANYIKRSEVS